MYSLHLHVTRYTTYVHIHRENPSVDFIFGGKLDNFFELFIQQTLLFPPEMKKKKKNV